MPIDLSPDEIRAILNAPPGCYSADTVELAKQARRAQRVAVLHKDGRTLYASPGCALGRALAEGWRVAGDVDG